MNSQPTFPPVTNVSPNFDPSQNNFASSPTLSPQTTPAPTPSAPTSPVTAEPTPPVETPSFSAPEPAPTDLSHLASLTPEQPIAENPSEQPSPPNTPFTPSQFIPPVQVNSNVTPSEDNDHKINTILIIVLPIIALVVLFGSIYYFFFTGTTSQTGPVSIPAEAQQAPLTQPRK
jgi:hypothetical protein